MDFHKYNLFRKKVSINVIIVNQNSLKNSVNQMKMKKTAGATHPYKSLDWVEFCSKINSNIVCTHKCKNDENVEKEI